MMGGSAATTCKLEYNINITTMKKARNLWRDLPQGGSRYGSVLTRLFLLLCLLATTQAGWAAINNTTVTKGSQKFIDVATTAASTGDEVTVKNQYIAYTVNELVSSAIRGQWFQQTSQGSGSSNSDAVSIKGYRSTCNKHASFSSSNKYTFYVTKCISFAILYDPRANNARYATITATNVDDNTDIKSITLSGDISSNTKYNVELVGLDESKYYKIELVTDNSQDSRLFQVRLESSSGPANPSFSVTDNSSLVKGSGTVDLTSTGNTVYYKWSQTNDAYSDGATLANTAAGNSTSTVTATAPSTTGTWYLYAVAKNGSNEYSDVTKYTQKPSLS